MNIYEDQAKSELVELRKVDDEFHQPRFEKLLSWIDIIKPETLIDIGCSWGYVMEMVPKSIKVIGIDISPTKVIYCRKLGFDAFQLDILTEQLPQKFCELVISMELLEHFNEPLEVAKICAKYGKYIVFSTPVYDDDKEAVDNKFHLRHILPTEHLEIVSQVGKVREFTVVKAPKPGYAWSMSLVETYEKYSLCS